MDPFPFISKLSALPNSFILMSIGSNSLQKLANIFSITRTQIKPYAIPITMLDWQRMFFGSSKKWNSSVATMERLAGSKTKGIGIYITKEGQTFKIGQNIINFKALAKSEAFPKKYLLRRVGMQGPYPIFAFVRNPVFVFGLTKTVSDEYLKAISRMLRDRRELLTLNLLTDYLVDKVYLKPDGSIRVKATKVIKANTLG
ncbi:MAG: hypothetical protein Barrevirus10_12 [Barrevirus sp.]|uniref:Uncharacterized protein n=1 Tax=Barrevirus sp. TaxID=2487763 RepID=A0A3G4ZQ98_9VIRU|nr:MAG: hypothetical protein Barrevirus10_12 [Barrevirus sp.]